MIITAVLVQQHDKKIIQILSKNKMQLHWI